MRPEIFIILSVANATVKDIVAKQDHQRLQKHREIFRQSFFIRG